jgi:sugar lactone lactonase YvrE
MHEALRALARDTASFFCVPPRDVLTLLYVFVSRGHRFVRKPEALRFCRTALTRTMPQFSMLCFDASDNIVVPLHNCKNNLYVYDKMGASVQEVGSSNDHNQPRACTIDSKGVFYVSEDADHCVNVYAADGHFKRTIGERQITGPAGLALSKSEQVLYVASVDRHAVMSYLVHNGLFLGFIGGGVLHMPYGVAVLSTGQIAVSSCITNGKVHVFDPNGTVALLIDDPHLTRPCQIAVDAMDNLYVANNYAHDVSIYSSSGSRRVIGRISMDKDGSYPVGVAIDSEGTVAVSTTTRVLLYKSL